jgi:thiosulfate dehydrogenase
MSMMKGILIGFLLALVLIAAGVGYYFSSGLAPAAAGDPAMPFEKRLAHMALDAHIDKQKAGDPPVPADEDNLLAGAKIYKTNCALCHGLPDQPPSPYEKTMYPMPTALFRGKGVTDDSTAESYWKAANGIRLSGMPAFKSVLTDTQLWQVSQLLAHAAELPASVKTELAPNFIETAPVATPNENGRSQNVRRPQKERLSAAE